MFDCVESHFFYNPAYDPCLPTNHMDQTDLHRSALFQPEPTDMELCDRHIQEGNRGSKLLKELYPFFKACLY